jgi:hypothetical protein
MSKIFDTQTCEKDTLIFSDYTPECDFARRVCFKTPEYDFYTQEYDFDTLECDFYTQSAIFASNV